MIMMGIIIGNYEEKNYLETDKIPLPFDNCMAT